MSHTCPTCNGQRGIEENEGYMPVWTPCYACNETGMVSEEAYRSHRIGVMMSNMAHEIVWRMRNACNEGEDCETWAFHAAENMMTERDYFHACVERELHRMESAMANLPYAVVTLMLDKFAPEGMQDEDTHKPATLPMPVIIPLAPITDDVPF